jgi:hypothetical protein
MRESTITVTMPSENPWMQGEPVEVDRAEAERIAKIAEETAEGLRDRKLQSAHAYDQPIMQAIKSELPGDPRDRSAMLRGVEQVLSKRLDRSDWYQGARAAHRTIQTHNAYATPGFAQARRSADIYGS